MDEFGPDIGDQKSLSGLGPSGRVALGGFAAAAAYFLWAEHRAHVVEYFPWGIAPCWFQVCRGVASLRGPAW